MTESSSSSDWVTERGDTWRIHLSGMEATLSPTDAPLISALRLETPCRIADIGCGGGGTAIEIVRRAPPGSQVHGFDIVPGLIELARGRIPRQGPDLQFDVADLMTAAPDAPYDRLASRFGTMFFDDPRAAFANMRQWLTPAGRFAFAVWGPPADNRWITTVRDLVARVVSMPKPDPHAPGPFRYADAGTLVALLDQVGFTQLQVDEWRGLLPIGGRLAPAEAARFALASFSSFGELLAQAGEASLATALRLLTDEWSHHYHDGAVRLEARIHVVTGAGG